MASVAQKDSDASGLASVRARLKMLCIWVGMDQKDSLRCRFGCCSCSRCPHVESRHYSLHLD